MPERITQITLQAFRGVRDVFDIALPQAQSLMIFGENGTGKSSLADGIEWYFTGEIELLAKEGRDHAVKHQGADAKMQPLVAIRTTGELGGACTPKGPNQAAIDAASRETFLLRGRTIADFVDKTKSEKWSALQRLLGLGGIDELRADLQKARSELKRTRDDASAKTKQATAALKAQGVEADKKKIEAALGDLAVKCGFEAQPSIDDYLRLNLKDLVEAPRSAAQGRAASLAQLKMELEQGESAPADLAKSTQGAVEKWNDTVTDTSKVDPSKVDVLSAATRFVIKNPKTAVCPVCDTQIASDALTSRLMTTLAAIQEHAAKFDAAEKAAKNALDGVTALHIERTRWRNEARKVSVELAGVPAEIGPSIKSAINDRKTIDVKALKAWLDAVGVWDDEARAALGKQAVPVEEPSQNRSFDLANMLVATRHWTEACAAELAAEEAYEHADTLFEAYQTEQRTYVQGVLEQISAEVGRLFSRLHPAKNIGSVAVETWADKGIELAIDFYGQRQRPPHGVLSESYMNSVAIVLFLAMARTFNENLQFLVLDDVVNSFDVTHRGRLGDLLLEEFHDWQLIVLTHDRYFFDQVRRKVKGWATYQILGWSYERGPALREQRGATDIDAAIELLDGGHIGDAARRGRRGLEHVLKEICEGLEVPLPYRRGNENEFREVGTLMMGLRRLLKEDSKGKAFLASIDVSLRALEADAQSVLNVESHASDQGASTDEVRSTLDRVKGFDEMWTCKQCNHRVWKEQGVRCKCGATPFPPPLAKA